MRLCPLYSGSSGNCIYVGSDDTHLLVDIGVSGKKAEEGLNTIGLTGRDINGILITHEHSDHIQGLGVFSRKYGVPMYATEATIEAILSMKSLGTIDRSLFNIVKSDERFELGDISVDPMKISHDAADPVAYRFRKDDRNIAVCTDLGCYTDYTSDCLSGMDALLIEANHDIRMLENGSYPYPLKMRILGEKGHLSNEASGKLLSSVLNDRIRKVFLGHLSKENNYPDLAFESVRMEITMGDNPYRASDFDISVAKRDVPSECIEV
ncbi:MAG: MBL fold metallo-hydrolase [Lachnospiraceae bacterium]|nr:MBL fold metallo-hydrolase [Lachnospiraceae bacterium]